MAQGKAEEERMRIEDMLRRGKTPEAIEEFCGYPMETILRVQKEIMVARE